MSSLPVMVITGTSKGIGRGLAEYYATHGYLVWGCSRREASLNLPNYFHTQLDVSDEKSVREWAKIVKRELQRVDVLVCNAGLLGSRALLLMTSGETLKSMWKVNVEGVFYTCREFAKIMLMKRFGRIITLGSNTSYFHLEGAGIYTATKSSVEQLTKTFAIELASSGITCNMVAPGLILTESVQAIGENALKLTIQHQTIKRTQTIDDIVNVISFFAAPENSCITGQVLKMGLID